MKPSGVRWVESSSGQKWRGYISGCGNDLYIGIVKEPSEVGWIVSFGPRVTTRRYATLFAAQREGVRLAMQCLTESLINLQKELEDGPSNTPDRH